MKTDSTSSQTNIFECSASYYNLATKKWDFGSFALNKIHIQFVCNNTRNDQFHLCLPLSTISGLEKRQSNLIHPSLVICVGSEKHWFSSFSNTDAGHHFLELSSFSNRDAVYNLLELFWRESLISKPHIKPKLTKVSGLGSSFGKELLNILYESENTLIETANMLYDQSQQLHDAEEAVEDMDNDLTSVEQNIQSLSSPLSCILLENSSLNLTSKSPESRFHKYKVTFSFSNDKNNIDWEKGILIITDEAVSLDLEGQIQLQIMKNELDVFQVLSPWEFCIVYTFAEVKKSCYFICPHLSSLLQFLTSIPHYKSKIMYMDDDSSVYETASCSSSSSFSSAVNSPSPAASCSSSKDMNSESNQTQINTNTLSDKEIEELNTILQNLQTLASEVNKEQENQMHRIEALITNMEKTEIRMKESNKKVKKIS